MNKKIITVLLISGIALTLGSCTDNRGEKSSSSYVSSVESSGSVSPSDLSSSSSGSASETKDVISFSLAGPNGAPSYALGGVYKENRDHITVGAPQSTVMPALATGSAGMLIFDSANMARRMKGKATNYYNYVGLITGGNVYVVATGHDANKTIDENDRIVSFGSGSIFTSVFKAAYGYKGAIAEVADTATAATVAATGLNGGEAVDYVLVAEPVLTMQIAQNKIKKENVLASLSDKWLEYTKEKGYNGGKGYSFYPQAGLFISKALEKDTSKKGEITSFIKSVWSACADFAENDGRKTLATIEADLKDGVYGDSKDTAFGTKIIAVKKCADESTNGFKKKNAMGFIDKNIDINAFLTETANDLGFPAYEEENISSYSSIER